jgi:hypothetical protein
MNEITRLILKNFVNGKIHVFSINERHYLYIRNLNQYFEVDTIAFDVFTKIKNGFNLDEQEARSFFDDWRSLGIEKLKPSKKFKAVKLYLTEGKGQAIRQSLTSDSGDSALTNTDRLDVFIRVTSGNIAGATDFITQTLDEIKELSQGFRVRISVTLKMKFDKLTAETMAFVKKYKLKIMPQLTSDQLTPQNIRLLKQHGLSALELLKPDLKAHDLDTGLTNFVRYSGLLDAANQKSLLNDLLSAIPQTEDRFVPEKFANILDVFKCLTSPGYYYTDVITSTDSTLDRTQAICNNCWAKNACHISNIYQTFGDHPYGVSENRSACETIYKLVENLIDRISQSQLRMLESANATQRIDLQEDGILLLINP